MRQVKYEQINQAGRSGLQEAKNVANPQSSREAC